MFTVPDIEELKCRDHIIPYGYIPHREALGIYHKCLHPIYRDVTEILLNHDVICRAPSLKTVYVWIDILWVLQSDIVNVVFPNNMSRSEKTYAIGINSVGGVCPFWRVL